MKIKPPKGSNPHALIPIGAGLMHAADGSIAIEPTKLKIPERSYVCDWVDVASLDADTLRLTFGQTIPFAAGNLSTMVVVRMARDHAREFFITRAVTFKQQVQAELKPTKPETISGVNPLSVKVHHEVATLALIARSGMDADIDFYYLSAGSIRHVRDGGTLGSGSAISALLRVCIPSGLLLHMLARVESVLEE